MAGRIIPETANRQDWPRLVSQGFADHEKRIAQVEAPVTVLVIEPSTAPSSPVEGTIYYDSATHKLKCWDGTAWQALW